MCNPLTAALIVTGQNFADFPAVLTFIMVAGVVGLLLLMPLAGEVGRRAAKTEA